MTENSEINAAAYIVTGEAMALGDPVALVMTRADETGEAQVLLAHLLPASADLTDALDELERQGYRFPNPPTEVETGYWVIDTIRP
jgi:hypothetical protein